ncbi:DUF4012 domain-containing protein [Actinotalea solisilvae]|uniref:DUF4012 domain-containing protein n=1 Tax=Actinotalea solisilvae TaxID=2072922 RepID=UPI0018F27063|nr:DUF4012 domain-containing protein [Actinotalea solisilvae]
MVSPVDVDAHGALAPASDAPADPPADVPEEPDALAARTARGRHRRGGRARTVRRALVVVGVLVLVAAGWLAVRGVQVVHALRAAVPGVDAVGDALRDGDVDAASARLPELQEHAATALAATRDPVWRAASALPWLGTQLDAVRDVSAALDVVASEVVPALADAAGAVGPRDLVPVDGAVPLAPVVGAQPAVAAAADAAARADALVAGIPTDGLVPPLATAVAQARGPLAEAALLLDRVDDAVALLPPMLGADGPRTYLVLVLNPAELRSGGGIVGSVAVLHAVDGRLTLGERLASRTLPRLDAPPALGAEELAVHGDRLGSIMQNVTMTPDFPRAAELAVEVWEAGGGAPVDGVLAVEPVALAHLLDVTGPVTAPDGTVLEADGVVRTLLHDAYARYPDPDATDAFFAASAAGIFDALVTVPGSPAGLVDALGRSVAERRVALWSAHAEEQERLAPSPLGGSFFDPAAADQAGVFLDDGTGTKLDYFLGAEVAVACADPVPGQGARAVLVVDLASTVPADPAELAALPSYMSTNGLGGTPTGVTRTNLTFYSPVGGRVAEIRSDGAAVGGLRGTEAGRDVAVLTATLAPGASVRYEVTVELPAGATGLGAWRTPGLEEAGTVPATTCES